MEVETNRVVIVPKSTEIKIMSYPKKNSGTSIHSKTLSKGSDLCYRMSDMVLTMCLIFPLLIGFWRGVWQLMDYYSELWNLDPWLSMAVGYSIPFFLYWLQDPLKKHIHPSEMRFSLFYIISRFLLLLHSFGSVNQWRGLWKLLDITTGVIGTEGMYSAIGSLVVGIFFSLILKTFCNILAPPLFVCIDEANSIHDCPLRFKTESKFCWRYFLDCFFSVIIVASLVVCCWRGLWNLADLYLYPEDEMKSALFSLGFGYALCIALCTAQPFIYGFVTNFKGLVRLTLVNMVTFLGFIGCVFAWRGLWNFYNLVVVFETETLSEWVTTIVGSIGTVIFGCVSAVVVRGIAIDGEVASDGTSEWPIPYISLLKTRIYDVPFPEPWICRYLCTSQKMNIGKYKRRRKGEGIIPKTEQDGAATALKKITNANLTNSVHPEDSYPKLMNNRLSDLPSIDSSSEEELGMRAKMIPVIEESDSI